MTQVAHVFYGVFMGWSHSSLTEIMKKNSGKDHLERGEVAIFVNKSWTAVKVLCPGNALMYVRTGSPLSVESLRIIPTLIGGSRLSFARNLENHLIKTHEARFGKSDKKLRVAFA